MPSLKASTESEGIGIVVALPAEARSMGIRGTAIGGCARLRGGWIALSGAGPRNATAAAERLLTCGVRRLANWGVAGALDATLQPGDLLIPDRILDAHDDTGFKPDAFACDRLLAALSPSSQVHRGALWSSDTPVTSVHDKRALATASGAVAVDMESAAVAAVAMRANLPYVAVKAICDPLERSLPMTAAQAFIESNGTLDVRTLMRILAGGPALWRSLTRLARDFAAARRTLAAAAKIVLRDTIAA